MTDRPKRLTQNISLYPEHKQALAWLAGKWNVTASEAVRTLIENKAREESFSHGYGNDWRTYLVIEPEQ